MSGSGSGTDLPIETPDFLNRPCVSMNPLSPAGKSVEKKGILGIMADQRIPHAASLSMAHPGGVSGGGALIRGLTTRLEG